MSEAIKLESFCTRMGREWRVLLNRAIVYEGDVVGAQNVKEALDEYARTLTDEVERLLAVQEEILMSRKVANDEVERLQGEVDRLTRDRDRLTSYALAAMPLCRDALTHIVEDRHEEATQTLFRVMCALASAAKIGVVGESQL